MPTIVLNGNDALFDSDKVENNSGVLSLKLQNNPSQDFVQEFTNDTGFTYDNTKTEFSGGKVQQIDRQPTDSTFYASYTTDEDAAWSNGVGTGTLGGTAAIDSGYLKFSGSSGESCTYSAINNSNSGSTGCVRMVVRPLYSGNPAGLQVYYVTLKTGATESLVSLQHETSGILNCAVYDQGGVRKTAGFGSWSPTSGVEYELELNWDLVGGAVRLFINGTQHGSTSGITATLDTTEQASLQIGYIISAQAPNFWVKDLLIFSTAQHTSNYTPSWSNIYEAIFGEDVITLPEMEYTGPGTLISFDAFTTTEGGSPRYTLQIGRSGNYLYWTGTMWTTSNNTYSQANDATTFNANVASLPVNGGIYGQFRMYWDDSSTQSSCDELTASLTAQTYPTDDPLVTFQTTIRTDGYISFTEAATKAGLDEVKYTLSKNGTQYYVSAGVWTVSDGSYSQMSDAIDIDTDITTFTTVGTTSTIRTRLHSETAATTPSLTSITVEYSFAGEAQDIVDTCMVYGYSITPDGSINTDIITITLNQDAVKYKTNTVLQRESITVTPESTTGYWEAEIVENDNMDGTARYIFDFGDRSYSVKVPNEASRRFWDLEEIQVVG